jgi:hypothetical protein
MKEKFNRLNTCAVIFVIISLLSLSGYSQCDRGRVYIENNTIVSDQGTLLRGGTFWLSKGHLTRLAWAQNREAWKTFQQYRLNAVRLACMFERPYSGAPGYNIDEMIRDIDSMVEWASQEGIYVMIDGHASHARYYIDNYVEFFTKVATRYKDRTHVFFELINEPKYGNVGGYDDQILRDNERLYKLIREIAPESHIVLLSFPNSDAEMIQITDKLRGIDWSNASVGFHPYHKYNSNPIVSLKEKYPVVNTEWEQAWTTGNMRAEMDGCPVNAQVMEKLGVSWFAWDHTDYQGDVTRNLNYTMNDAQQKGYLWEADNYDLCPVPVAPEMIRYSPLADAAGCTISFTPQTAHISFPSAAPWSYMLYAVDGACVGNSSGCGTGFTVAAGTISPGRYLIRIFHNREVIQHPFTIYR